MKLLVAQFSPFRCYLGSSIFLSTLFLKTFSLRPVLNFTDHVSHPHKTKGKISVLYILVFILLDGKREYKKDSGRVVAGIPQINLLLITSRMQF
jgi:hypothetical protein